MQHTLIAVFDNRSAALKSRDALLDAGFARADVRLSEGDPSGHASESDTVIDRREDESFGDSIRHFFNTIFGVDRGEAAQMYSEAVARGHYVLALSATDERETERAADVVERFGPIDIEEKHRHWRGADMLHAAPGAQQQAAPMSQQLAPGQGRAQAAARGARQAGEHGNVRIYHTLESMLAQQPEQDGSPGIQRRSVDHMVDPADVPALQEEYRKHWGDNFADEGSFDEFAPAYHYGAQQKRSQLYRDRPWDEAVEDLRVDWEAVRPGSAWDKFKAAVRHGWERITHH